MKKTAFVVSLLVIGLAASTAAAKMYVGAGIGNTFFSSEIEDAANQVKEIDENLYPARTSIDGVFAAGSSSAARDIPDTILHAGAAAAQAAAHVERRRAQL